MKKFAPKIWISMASLLPFFTACSDGKNMKTTTISINDDIKITYTGTIKINQDTTDFKSISQDGFVKYKNGDTHITVERENTGTMKYDINGDKKSPNDLNETDKKLLTESLHDMIKKGAKFQ